MGGAVCVVPEGLPTLADSTKRRGIARAPQERQIWQLPPAGMRALLLSSVLSLVGALSPWVADEAAIQPAATVKELERDLQELEGFGKFLGKLKSKAGLKTMNGECKARTGQTVNSLASIVGEAAAGLACGECI